MSTKTEIANQADVQLIGYLCIPEDKTRCIGFEFRCLACHAKEQAFEGSAQLQTPTATRCYRVNIGPYKQTCHICNEVVVEGATPAWSELFGKVVK